MLRPMLASLADAPLQDPQLVYEPKYDGIRAIAEVGGRPPVRLWSRLGNEKTAQFPEIAAALERWAAKRKQPVVLDGEIVALDEKGRPAGFQQLQGRIHVSNVDESTGGAKVAFIAFDLLREGQTDLRDRPFLERRAALERVFGKTGSPLLRISEIVQGDGRALYQRALAQGWEGLIAKHASSLYKSGKRTPDWRKLKIVQEQEFVIGGWTEPRQSRAYFGALLLGVYEPRAAGRAPRLVYVGHTGTGFSDAELARVMKRLKPLETAECPFDPRPKTNERPHWVRPELVAQIKFTEWTSDGKLRHPVYLGLRDDKKPEEVQREVKTRLHAGGSAKAPGSRVPESKGSRAQESRSTAKPGTRNHEPGTRNQEPGTQRVVDQLRTLEDSRKDGVIELPDGDRLNVTNLHKVFWPKLKLTKGDLLRYYAQVAPFILPTVADRPLVMKRFPNGIGGKPFYQHRAPDVPEGVRVETVVAADARPQIIGGNLKTLLYMTQIAAISQDPWFSRVQTPEFADYAALDLDPAEGVPFGHVLDVARWIRDELDALGALGVPKTSGADGLHIYLPLPPKTPYEAGQIFCQIIGTVVAHKHPRVATVERAVRARGARVYVDYLQNIQGKTLATAYSARASVYAGVSTPLTWEEIDKGVRREDFTIETTPGRLKEVGDLWAALRKSKGVDLSRVSRYEERAGMRRSKGKASR
jgi:bifunctional non-homologous end joining protein LigD